MQKATTRCGLLCAIGSAELQQSSLVDRGDEPLLAAKVVNDESGGCLGDPGYFTQGRGIDTPLAKDAKRSSDDRVGGIAGAHEPVTVQLFSLGDGEGSLESRGHVIFPVARCPG